MNENPHYKFKRQKNYKIVDKVHKNSNESILAEPMFTHLPNINQLSNEASTNQSTNQKSANTVDIPINQSAVIKDNENKKINKFSIQTNKSSDAKENKQNPDFISKPNKTEPESSTLTRPKTDVSDRNKSKQLASNDIETLLGSSESQGVLKDLASNSSQLLMSTAEGETGHAHGHLEFLEEVGDPATGLPIGATTDNLKAAIAGETHEYTDMYPGMAKSAREEGFDEIANWFETLAKAEKSHAVRFQKAIDTMA